MAVYAGRNGLGDDDDEDVAIFIEEVDLESTSAPPQIQAITAAAEIGDVDALRLALDNYHGSIDDPIEDGDPVLHLCCLYGHLPCVQLVVERGASLESKDAEGAIPLHDACAGGFTEIVQYIFNAAGSPETIKRMLEAVDVEGDTPLHNASRGEHVDVVNLLLSFGASPKKTNASGETPAELADPGAQVVSILEAAAVASDSMACQ